MKIIGEYCAISEDYYKNNKVNNYACKGLKLGHNIVNFYLISVPVNASLTGDEQSALCSVIDYYVSNYGKIDTAILINIIITFISDALDTEIGYGKISYYDKVNGRVITESKFFFQFKLFILSVTVDNIDHCLELLEDLA